MLVLALLACLPREPDLAVASVAPAELSPGAPVVVHGAGFSDSTQVWLHGAAGEVRLDVRGGADRLEGAVPELPAGAYALVLSQGAQRVSVDVQVLGPAVETPCGRAYRVNTHLSLADGVAVIERFHADGTRDRVTTALVDIERVEYLDAVLDGGRTCSAILLRKTDGAALLYEDDDARSLLPRAETLAEYMRKELTVGGAL